MIWLVTIEWNTFLRKRDTHCSKLKILDSKNTNSKNTQISKEAKQYHGFKPPTKTTVLSAMRFCPAAPKPAATSAFKVASMLASGMTTAWFFAPTLDWRQQSASQFSLTSTTALLKQQPQCSRNCRLVTKAYAWILVPGYASLLLMLLHIRKCPPLNNT